MSAAAPALLVSGHPGQLSLIDWARWRSAAYRAAVAAIDVKRGAKRPTSAVAVFHGTGSYNTSIEVAYRHDGAAFIRYYEFRYRGKSWGKWSPYKTSTTMEQAITQGYIECGFSKLRGGASDSLKLRLPAAPLTVKEAA